MTVNESLVSYSQANNFRFPQKHKLVIGSLVVKEYRNLYGADIEIPTIMSAEETGTFKVLDYPDHFRFRMDEIVHEYVLRLKESGRKKITEKPNTTQPRTDPISYSSDPAKIPKKRTRKPIQSSPKLECSGKSLKK